MATPTPQEAHRAWLTAEKIKLVSDRLVGFGPFGIGLDGLLAFVPVAGGLYSLAAGVWLINEGVRAGAGAWTLTRMTAYVGVRTLSAEIPLIGQAFDVVFRGHMMAAVALQKDIDIPPTITVPQGQAIRVFVSRDLDFSDVLVQAR